MIKNMEKLDQHKANDIKLETELCASNKVHYNPGYLFFKRLLDIFGV